MAHLRPLRLLSVVLVFWRLAAGHAAQLLCSGSPVSKCVYFCHLSGSGPLAAPGEADDPSILLEFPMAQDIFHKPLALNWRLKLCYRLNAAAAVVGQQDQGKCWGPFDLVHKAIDRTVEPTQVRVTFHPPWRDMRIAYRPGYTLQLVLFRDRLDAVDPPASTGSLAQPPAASRNWAYDEPESKYVFACTASLPITSSMHQATAEIPCTGKGGGSLASGTAPYWIYLHPVTVPSIASTTSMWFFDHKLCNAA